ncbi:MAG: peptide ABC transporter substrate-binding protein, partial [Gemmobacter sp.]|nr:peptide ABC transporter substrate-binding protein [Gemmobacter sp.]
MADASESQNNKGRINLTSLMRRDFLGLGIGLAAGCALLPGLSGPIWAQGAPSTATPPASRSGVVVVGLSQEPVSFHPLMPGVEVDEIIWTNIFSSLWVAHPDGSLVPDLALEVPSIENGGIAEGGLLWTVRLRDDVKWHDGAPFTAEDVKFSLDLINVEGFRSRTRVGHSLVSDVTVVSPTEITWRMSEAFSPYLALLANTHMVPRHLLQDAADPNDTPFGTAPVGTGPFRWGTRTPGDNITLLAYDEYHGDGPYVEQSVLKYVPDMTSLYAQFRTGQVDAVIGSGIPHNFYEEAIALPDRNVVVVPSGNIELVMPNLGLDVLSHKEVRQALYYGMNKQVIIDAIYYGVPQSTESFAPRESWAYNPDLELHVYDPARANQILDDAGWVPGSGGVREKDGVRLAFKISTTTGNALREQVQQLLIQDWAAIGVDLSIENMPAAVIWGDFYVRSQFESL